MKNIYNRDLFVKLINRMNFVCTVSPTKIIIEHTIEDWDFICILAQRLDQKPERWMQNQEPRTTVYLEI